MAENFNLEQILPGLQGQTIGSNLGTVDFSGATNVLLPSGTTIAGAAATPNTITSNSANALAVGPNGTTNPVFDIDASTASAATGIKVKGAAAAAGVAISVLSSGTNENLTIDAKGSGTITINGAATGAVTITPATTITGALTTSGGITNTGSISSTTAILSSGGVSGIGYSTGAGGAVTQITSRTTGVTLNKITGQITLVSAAGSATPASFTVTNSAVAATDTIVVHQASGTDLYEIFVTAVAAGSFRITSFTTGGTTTETPVFNFTVIKGVAA